MSSSLTCLKVFIASPSGLIDERKAFRDEIHHYNEVEAIPRGFLFQSIGWEDAPGGVGRPQSIINEDVRSADYFILLLWDRWGSPPDANHSGFSSGTEEEYHIALECHTSTERPMGGIVMMFRSVSPEQLSDPGPQLQRVLEFRKTIEREKSHLFYTFDSLDAFRGILRKHLARWLLCPPATGPHPGPSGLLPSPGRPTLSSTATCLPQDDTCGSSEERPSDPLTKSLAGAWDLANAGRLTEAEIEFSRLVVGRREPEPAIEYARFLVRLGRLDQAEGMLEEAASSARDQEDDRALANAYGSLGHVLDTRGDLDGAEEMHRKALEIDEKLGRLEGMADDYGNLGQVFYTRGDLDRAEEMHRKSLEIDKKLGRLDGMASDYGSLGNVLYTRGDLDRAEEMYRKALEIDEKLGRLEGMATQYGNLGNVLYARGDLDRAEEMHRKSIEIEEKLGRLEGMASEYRNLGHVLHTRGNLDGAKEMYRKALEVAERLGSPTLIASVKSALTSLRRQRAATLKRAKLAITRG